jgi:hypothetical protein
LETNKWKDKIQQAFFRGSSSGCGYDLETNPRLKLSDISFKWNKTNDKKGLLNVAVSRMTHKILAYKSVIGLIDLQKYKYLEGSFVDIKEQMKFKYIFNIEGFTQAYRFGNEFKKNSVILNVVSDYHMWFEPLLKNNKHLINVNPNFNNLYDIIIELKNNDKKAEQIANNGLLFSNKYINQDSLCTYWFFYMFYSNKYYKH